MQYIQIWRSWSLSLPSTRLPCLFSGGEGPRGGKVLGILHSVAQMARVLSVIYGVWCCGGLRLRQCVEAPARVSTQQPSPHIIPSLPALTHATPHTTLSFLLLPLLFPFAPLSSLFPSLIPSISSSACILCVFPLVFSYCY